MNQGQSFRICTHLFTEPPASLPLSAILIAEVEEVMSQLVVHLTMQINNIG